MQKITKSLKRAVFAVDLRLLSCVPALMIMAFVFVFGFGAMAPAVRANDAHGVVILESDNPSHYDYKIDYGNGRVKYYIQHNSAVHKPAVNSVAVSTAKPASCPSAKVGCVHQRTNETVASAKVANKAVAKTTAKPVQKMVMTSAGSHVVMTHRYGATMPSANLTKVGCGHYRTNGIAQVKGEGLSSQVKGNRVANNAVNNKKNINNNATAEQTTAERKSLAPVSGRDSSCFGLEQTNYKCSEGENPQSGNKNILAMLHPSPEFLNSLALIKKFHPLPQRSEGEIGNADATKIGSADANNNAIGRVGCGHYRTNNNVGNNNINIANGLRGQTLTRSTNQDSSLSSDLSNTNVQGIAQNDGTSTATLSQRLEGEIGYADTASAARSILVPQCLRALVSYNKGGYATGFAIPVSPMGDDSLYTITEVASSSGNNVITVVETDASGKTAIKNYQITLKTSTYGSGNNTKYYKWEKTDTQHIRLTETTNASEAVLTVKYNNVADIRTGAGVVTALIDTGVSAQSIKNKIDVLGTVNKITSDFVGGTNNVTASDTYAHSAILTETSGKIGDISSSFVGNIISATGRDLTGGLIKSMGSIDSITGEFLSNIVTADVNVMGGLVTTSTTGSIGAINAQVINNVVTSSSNVRGTFVYNAGTLGGVSGSFINNKAVSTGGNAYGSAVYNTGTLSGDVSGTFEGNATVSSSGSALGGAVYNDGIFSGSIKNSTFAGNYAQGATARGGAVYTAGNMGITADGGNTVFVGNYTTDGTTKTPNDVYVGSNIATLTVTANNGGAVKFYDGVSGESGYSMVLTGDGKGTIGFYGTGANVLNNGKIENVKDWFTENVQSLDNVEKLQYIVNKIDDIVPYINIVGGEF